jgi:hypothetical protein
MFIMWTMALTALHQGEVSIAASLRLQTASQRSAFLHSAAARMGLLLNGLQPPGDAMSLSEDFMTSGDGGSLQVSWANEEPDGPWEPRRGSRHQPSLNKESTPERLFPDSVSSGFPRIGYPQAAGVVNGTLPTNHTAVAFRAPGSGRYVAVYEGNFPYGAFAPHGSITSTGPVVAWGNPTTAEVASARKDGPNPDFLTPVPVRLLAQEAIRVKLFPHGKAESSLGPIDAPGGGLAFTRELTAQDGYGNDLRRRVNEAFNDLAQDPLDKTQYLSGHPLTITSFLALFTGDTSQWWGLMSLQQAMMLPIPIFPQVRTEPWAEILSFQVPFLAEFGGSATYAKLINDKITEFYELFESAWKAVKDTWDAVKSGEILNPAKLKELLEDYYEATKNYAILLSNIKTYIEVFKLLVKFIKDPANFLQNEFHVITEQVPVNEEQEKNVETLGWVYGELFWGLAKNFATLFSNPKSLLTDNTFITPTRVVHLGGTVPEFYWRDGEPLKSDTLTRNRPWDAMPDYLYMKTTLTVPRGRTLKLRDNVQVAGDVWLQRGSTLYIAGNMAVTHPSSWTDSDLNEMKDTTAAFMPNWVPKGRIIMEEGASLLVDGQLFVKGGTPVGGSITVTAPLGRVQPVTTTVLCKGNVYLEYGVCGGALIDDYCEAALKNSSDDTARSYPAKFLKPYFTDIGPNTAKFIGVFSTRLPWFAQYKTTIEMFPWLASVDLPPGPYPMPLPYYSCLPKLFSRLSWLYRIELGFSLGNNFYPMARTWPFGRGSVPVMPRVIPPGKGPDIEEITRNAPDWSVRFFAEALQEFVLHGFADVFRDAINAAGRQYLEHMISELMPGDTSCEGKEAGADERQEKIEKTILKAILTETAKESLKALARTTLALHRAIEAELSDHMGDTAVDSPVFREVPGLFLYSGGTLSMGSGDHYRPCWLASGFFVAENDIDLKAERTVGALVSLKGDIRTQDLHFYPYFTRASPYRPQRMGEYPDNKIPDLLVISGNIIKDVIQFNVPVGGAARESLTRNTYHITARGWDLGR